MGLWGVIRERSCRQAAVRWAAVTHAFLELGPGLCNGHQWTGMIHPRLPSANVRGYPAQWGTWKHPAKPLHPRLVCWLELHNHNSFIGTFSRKNMAVPWTPPKSKEMGIEPGQVGTSLSICIRYLKLCMCGCANVCTCFITVASCLVISHISSHFAVCRTDFLKLFLHNTARSQESLTRHSDAKIHERFDWILWSE